tara:strand:+ start:161 stop:670 length:510 start_codon:yes stop_codon:yes gene_type:complete
MIKKPILIKKKKHVDKRGYFQEVYLYKEFGINILFTAKAYSKKNVIRGLHFQTKDKQTKFIHVVKGKILDVVVDLKKNSYNFGKVYKYILDEGDTLIVPNTFAHGYECLSKNCTVFYHLDKYRNIKGENGILFNDKDLKIKWKSKKPIISKRDRETYSFAEFKKKIKTL